MWLLDEVWLTDLEIDEACEGLAIFAWERACADAATRKALRIVAEHVRVYQRCAMDTTTEWWRYRRLIAEIEAALEEPTSEQVRGIRPLPEGTSSEQWCRGRWTRGGTPDAADRTTKPDSTA